MKRITELNACECRWPVSEDEDGHFFCSAYTSDGPYCRDHSPRAFVPARQYVDRPAKFRGRGSRDGYIKGVQERANATCYAPVDKLLASPALKRFEAAVGVHEPA